MNYAAFEATMNYEKLLWFIWNSWILYSNLIQLAAHLRLVLLSILNAKFDNFVAWVGLVCSSYVAISQGSHYRAPWFPLGLEGVPFVELGNKLTSRIFGLKVVSIF